MAPHRLAWVRWGGWLLLGGSCVFIVERLLANQLALRHWQPGPYQIQMVLTASLVYGASQFLLSTAWCRLLRLGGQTMDPRTCHRIYGTTQIGKYLPGNLFHYAGRHVQAHRFGVGHVALLTASGLEVIGFLAAAGGLALAGILAWHQGASPLPPLAAAGLTAGGCLAAGLIAWAVHRRFSCNPVARGVWQQRRALRLCAEALVLDLAFVAVAGCLVLAVVHSLPLALSWPQAGGVVSAFAIAWILGFLTPGAPGGLGVREAAMVLLLEPITGGPDALAVAGLTRVITTAGDLAFFLMAGTLGYFQTDRRPGG